jgi:ubiquitin-like protein Pup
MAKRVQKPKPKEQEAVVFDEEPVKSAEETKQEIDELLAEIDGVLEQNAEEFVKGYVQKGGE